MHAIFCFVKNNRRGGFHDRISGFHASLSRQTMHKEALFAGGSHQFIVHLKTPESHLSLLGFFLLPHRSPHIGVDYVGTLHRCSGIVTDLYLG